MDMLTHETAYRGEDAINKVKVKPIIVGGCGAIGSNLIYNMAKQGFENISVIDDDRIEKHNTGSQMWSMREVNGKKVQIMKNMVFAATGKVAIKDIDKKLTESSIKKLIGNDKNSIFIDGFDNAEARGLVTNYCKDNKLECLHIGLSDTYAEVVWNDNYIVPSGKKAGPDVCEYPLSRNIAMFAVTIGIETLIKFITEGIKKSYSITLKDLKISELD